MRGSAFFLFFFFFSAKCLFWCGGWFCGGASLVVRGWGGGEAGKDGSGEGLEKGCG